MLHQYPVRGGGTWKDAQSRAHRRRGRAGPGPRGRLRCAGAVPRLADGPGRDGRRPNAIVRPGRRQAPRLLHDPGRRRPQGDHRLRHLGRREAGRVRPPGRRAPPLVPPPRLRAGRDALRRGRGLPPARRAAALPSAQPPHLDLPGDDGPGAGGLLPERPLHRPGGPVLRPPGQPDRRGRRGLPKHEERGLGPLPGLPRRHDLGRRRLRLPQPGLRQGTHRRAEPV